MLDVSSTHRFSACADFAVQWLRALASRDFKTAKAMIDEYASTTPLEEWFTGPEWEDEWPISPDNIKEWTFRVCGSDESGLCLDFEVPLSGEKFRPMEAQFDFEQEGDMLRVRFQSFNPS